MSDRRARRQSAIDNDKRILDAAVEIADAVGLDRLTVSAVAKTAGFTSGAVYARYGNREELLVALWEHRAAEHLESVIRQVGTFRRRGATDSYRTAIIDAVAPPSPGLRIAIETCLIAHRIDELHEIVPRTVREWLVDLGLDRVPLSPDEAVDLAAIAGVVGSIALSPLPGRLGADLDASVQWISAPAQPPLGDPLPPTDTAQQLVIEPDDPIRNDLLVAAQSVIARSGVHRTTLARIGRLARLAPATLYSRYHNRDELIADILRRSQVSNSQTKHRLDYLAGDAQMSAALHAFLQPEALVRRRMHCETIVAAWHTPAIADVYCSVEQQAMDDVARHFPPGLIDAERLMEIQRISLMAIHGSAILLEVLPEIAHLDWRPASALLLTGALQDA
ncbi:MAG: TetR/AcrR family transcriptional regulator [Ilumatobacteraceae bacterium]